MVVALTSFGSRRYTSVPVVYLLAYGMNHADRNYIYPIHPAIRAPRSPRSICAVGVKTKRTSSRFIDLRRKYIAHGQANAHAWMYRKLKSVSRAFRPLGTGSLADRP